MRILILGGTSEASALARALVGRADLEPELSLAGRTQSPAAPPISHRLGGFGGAEGLARYLASSRFHAVIDATHPFAKNMSRNAAEACAALALPLVAFTRPPWVAGEGDRWTTVPSAEEAAAALGPTPRSVFLTVGRLSLPAFAAAPQHRYVVRTIDPPAGIDALPDHKLILARGPFEAEAEVRLMREEGVEVLVSKDSGGEATRPKLDAARELGIPVVMIRRPAPPDVPVLHDLDAVLAWIEAHRP
jgi:precorrin-6A/cobalt-precorrin-6A reductase